MTLSIKQIEEQLLQRNKVDEALLAMLDNDERKGVQTLLKRYHSREKKRMMLENMHQEMTQYENQLRLDGFTQIAGLDEVGRGPLAGPVVVAAVILPETFKLLGLTDSKKLSKIKRQEFSDIIKRESVTYTIQMIHAEEIDRINIYQATKQAMMKAVEEIDRKPDHLLIDAMSLELPIPQTSLIKGDQRSITIAASSVLAKVARDDYMGKLDQTFPGYGFSSHAGYGTKEHLEAIERLGLTPEHRRSFRPIKEIDQI
ncbi:ribonuclease HII [Halalkalibacter nanhaiisediminis]|uniref:Ribonuclease HII n=1 Tax=Halalkalibacter nanhaiisediminis TaxID=688079 RepID=A0A562QG37_9BACI|nr:ribonuclease HII [Halalkalibacter nanhaiisediminis]TWI55140.1 RNase HII [Halalkalibacter nanhaiisediminis]